MSLFRAAAAVSMSLCMAGRGKEEIQRLSNYVYV